MKPLRQLLPDASELRDVRGLGMIWEEPSPREIYYLGADPTQGITGWNRYLRSQGDKSTDNAALEVIRLGRQGEPDAQAAEFAAPLDAEDFAKVVNHVGRMYGGSHESGQAEVICELTGGHGVITQRELMSSYQYKNLFIWKFLDGATIKRSLHIGWQASKDSNLALFSRCLRHINNNRIIVRSPWLIEEFADCTSDWVLGTLRAKWGRHDDRVRAFFLAIWAAHSWSNADDTMQPITERTKPLNPVALPLTVEEMQDGCEADAFRDAYSGVDDQIAAQFPD